MPEGFRDKRVNAMSIDDVVDVIARPNYSKVVNVNGEPRYPGRSIPRTSTYEFDVDGKQLAVKGFALAGSKERAQVSRIRPVRPGWPGLGVTTHRVSNSP